MTFITNETGNNLKERFAVLIKDTKLFDVLVGYFYTSGFHAVYKSLEKTEKIRILIGISTNRQTYNLIEESKEPAQISMEFSHAEAKDEFERRMMYEMEWEAKDNAAVEGGVHKFMEWLRLGKLEIRAYPSQNIHAKLYIMTFPEGDRDKGRVITGSSNFTRSGLAENLEFNVELKNRADYEYAQAKFEELWKDSVDVSEKYIETIENKTWLNDSITPYELYLKFLYEYFKDEINRTGDVLNKYVPESFRKLEYQEQAVLNAKKIVEEYGGVFIADVVGLGKTYMAAMLAGQLDGRNLVIAPPALLDENNPGSWKNVFDDFHISASFESIGRLETLIERGTDKYKNVFIDEAHRFRNESNVTYENLARICRGKRVILVSATPYNNSPKDILSLIKLFQKGKSSTIPNQPNLEAFFTGLERKLKTLDRQKDKEEYIQTVKANAKEVREKVLKHLMVRRTRSEIMKYFSEDLAQQKLRFPDVADPEAVFYEFSALEDRAFTETVSLVARGLTYARYMPLSSKYYKGDIVSAEEQAQVNLSRFMKILLIKRLESSFYAFQNTVDRFIHSYERFIEEYEKGFVYVSPKHALKIFDLLEDGDDDGVQSLVDGDKAQKYESKEFKKEFESDLRKDLDTLKKIKDIWSDIDRDPKLLTFVDILSSRKLLKESKLIIFTESKETALYLEKKIGEALAEKVLCFTGSSDASRREQVIKNFDAKVRSPRDDYRILVTTEVLSEGVNLHRSNVVINYDIPWNPTRLMQRVGRINRVDTKFPKIYTFNFFPTDQANDEIKLKEAAESKISAFIAMLGSDARLLTEGEEITSHDLFERLTSKRTILGDEEEEESELKYLGVIRDLRDNNPDLFAKIKRLPKKARTARTYKDVRDSVLTYFRKGKLQKFYIAGSKSSSQELDFMSAAALLEAPQESKKEKLGTKFYELLDQNKDAFKFSTNEELEIMETTMKGRDNAMSLLKILRTRDIRQFKGYTEGDEAYLESVIRELQDGGIPKQTLKDTMKLFKKEMEGGVHPLKMIAVLRTSIPEEFFKEILASSAAKTAGPREVILSEYFTA